MKIVKTSVHVGQSAEHAQAPNQEVAMSKQVSNKSVTAYLASLIWDGIPRLDRWLIDCAGAVDTANVRAVSRMMLVAAVRRARNPGCSFDQLPVIVGPQGSGKSSALRVLAVEEAWFTDDLLFHGYPHRLIEATAGKWIVEASGLGERHRLAKTVIKSLLAHTYDEARMVYARESTRVPRSFVVIGTTCEGESHLFNNPGKPRLTSVCVKRFDLDMLHALRDQLWAEAGVAETRGEPINLGSCVVDTAETPVDDEVLLDFEIKMMECEGPMGSSCRRRPHLSWLRELQRLRKGDRL